MGRARSHGYHFDNPSPASSIANGVPVSTIHRQPASNASPAHRPKGAAAVSSPPQPPSATGRGRGSGRERGDRKHRNRRSKDQGCRNPQVRKGVGSCVFVLGIPCLIAGLIFTIVSSTDDSSDGSRKYPASFPVLGPILLVLSVLCFLAGVLLYNDSILKGARDCLRLWDKDSFMGRHFPRLTSCLRPDPSASLHQAAIQNLQTAPARSALRRVPNPDLVIAIKTGDEEDEEEEVGQGGRVVGQGDREIGQGDGEGRADLDPQHPGLHNHHHHHHHHHQHHPHHHHHQHHPLPRRKRAVTFSEGDEEDLVPPRTRSLSQEEEGGVFVRLNSVSSEPDRLSFRSDSAGLTAGQSPSSSTLSLRHCRIRPREDVFWTDTSAAATGDREESCGGSGVGVGVGGGCGGGVGVGGGCGGGSGGNGHPADGVTEGGGGENGGGVGFGLADIDEERA